MAIEPTLEHAAAEPLVLAGVTVVDTRTGQLSPPMSVLLSGGSIRQIVPTGVATEGTSRTIDAQGKFLVPGFLDMHSHILQADHAPRDTANLMLAYGITGTRQMAGDPNMLANRASIIEGLGPDAPEILEVPGEILMMLNCPNPEAGIAEVQRQKAQGADFIKTIFLDAKTFYATLAEGLRLNLKVSGHIPPAVDIAEASRKGISSIEHLGPTEMSFIATSSREWLIRLILKLRPPRMPDLSPEAMAKMGRVLIANPIVGRLNGDPAGLSKTQGLIDSYQESKARKLADTFAQNNTWQCLTVIRNRTMQFCDDPIYTQSPDLRFIAPATLKFWNSVAQMFTAKVPPANRDTLKKLAALELRLVKIFDEAGVKMTAGSDYGGGWVIPGVSLHQEFDLLAEAGLSPLKILQMTTLSAAEFLGRQSTLGTIEEGKHANLVLLDANPVDSAQNLHKVHAVLRAGRFYDARALEDLKDGVAGRVSAVEPGPEDSVEAIP